MRSFPWQCDLPEGSRQGGSGNRLCHYAEEFQRIQEALFSQITASTSPQQFEQAQESLLLLKQELIQRMETFHFPYPSGGHLCVEDCYIEAAFRLKNLALLAPEPAPKQRTLSADEVVNNLEQMLSPLPQESLTFPKDTFLGQER